MTSITRITISLAAGILLAALAATPAFADDDPPRGGDSSPGDPFGTGVSEADDRDGGADAPPAADDESSHASTDRGHGHDHSPRIELGDPRGPIVGWTAARPDGHAPIGVMADHTHAAGEWMLSYRYMLMLMDGNRDGSHRQGDGRVLNDFPVAPTDMSMQMHMIGVMYAPTDDLTLMAMVPIVYKSMDHDIRTGGRFTTESDGIGDVSLTALYKVLDSGDESGGHRIHLNLGISFPTGGIGEKDTIFNGATIRLPYPMQLGSGTFDMIPGFTYMGESDDWSWGGQAKVRIPISGHSRRGYSWGEIYTATAWGARRVTDWLGLSLRAELSYWENFSGRDRALNGAVVPTADPDRRAGKRLDVFVGANFKAPSSVPDYSRGTGSRWRWACPSGSTTTGRPSTPS